MNKKGIRRREYRDFVIIIKHPGMEGKVKEVITAWHNTKIQLFR